MNAKKILTEEIGELTVSSLPSRPTAETPFGGRGYTANELKAAFDRLPLFIVNRFNALIDDVAALGEESLAAAIHTGIFDDHTLFHLFQDILTGRMSTYMRVLDKPLIVYIAEILERLNNLEEKVK